MADDYTNTAEHRIAVPAITDQWNFTREITNLRTRLNKASAGTAAYNSDGTNYVLSADNAGALLSRGGGFPRGSVIGAASGEDPYLTFYLNTGAALSGAWSIGVDDSQADRLTFEGTTSLGSAPEMTIARTTGNVRMLGDLIVQGGDIGVDADTNLLILDTDIFRVNGAFNLVYGSSGSNGNLRIRNINKTTVAAAGTAVIDTTINYGAAIVRCWVTVWLTSSATTCWQGELVATITNAGGGTDAVATQWHTSGGGIAGIGLADFVFSRPGGGVLRLTFTNDLGVSVGMYALVQVSHWNGALTSITIT